MRGNDYEEQVKKLNLTTLGTRRLNSDLIEVFKITEGFDDVNSSTPLAYLGLLLEVTLLNCINQYVV